MASQVASSSGAFYTPTPLEPFLIWVAVKEVAVSYFVGETLLFIVYIYIHYGYLV